MGLSTSGIFSGINTDDVVSKLMQVERQPLLKLQKKEADYQAKISGLGTLLSSIKSLKDAVTALKDSKIVGARATSGDTAVFSATATTGASPANHSIKVNYIAAAQSIYSAAFVNTTDPVADLSVVPTQKLQIQVGTGQIVSVTVDSTNNSLSGIKSAINNAKAGVSASILNDGSGNRLVITADSTGAANKIVIKTDEDNNGVFEEAADTDAVGLSRLAFNATYDVDGNVTGGIANMTQSQVAKNASLIVDGLTVSKASNTITDVIEGVSISLKKDSAGSFINLSVSKDYDSVKSKINAFVSVYNSAMGSIRDLIGSKDVKGTLGTDSTISALRNTMRNTISSSFSSSSLARLGIAHDKNGVLVFTSATFDAEIAASEANVVATLNAMATSLEVTLDTYVKTAIPEKQKSYEATAKMLTKREEALLRKLDKVELELRKKFNNLDSLMSQLQGRSNYLTQQISQNNSSK